MSPRAVFWNLVMFSFPFLPPFDICRELAISQGITFSFFSEISLKNEKIKMLSLVKLPIPCGYRKGEGRGRKTSQGFRKRSMGTCWPFQNGILWIFRFLKFFTSVCIKCWGKNIGTFFLFGPLFSPFQIWGSKGYCCCANYVRFSRFYWHTQK